MAQFALAVAKVIGSGGAWVIGSKLFGHGLDKSSKQWQKLTAKPQDWQQVILNIGGIRYPTSRKTVLTSPKLSSLIHSTEYNKSKEIKYFGKDQFWHEINDNPLEFFIDRDPTHFRYILNYIRNNKHTILPTDTMIRKELSIEANFYELHDLVTQLNYNKESGAINKRLHIASNLITKNEAHLLREWIEENDNDNTNELYCIDLLYRASDYGFSAKMFHDLCDNKIKGRTLVLVQAENGYIFGYYDNYVRRNGFIFLLRAYGNDETELRKWSLKSNINTMKNDIPNEMEQLSDYGPCFTDSITILDKCNITDKNEAYIGEIFDEPATEKTTLSGTVNFKVSEYEVFEVIKVQDYKVLKYY